MGIVHITQYISPTKNLLFVLQMRNVAVQTRQTPLPDLSIPQLRVENIEVFEASPAWIALLVQASKSAEP